MAGINSLELARSLGIRARLVDNDRYVAMNFDDWIEVVEKDRARRGWSLETATEMMTTQHTDEVSETPIVKPGKKPVRQNIVFDASQIVVRKIK